MEFTVFNGVAHLLAEELEGYSLFLPEGLLSIDFLVEGLQNEALFGE